MSRYCFILFLLGILSIRVPGADGEAELFQAATEAFKDKFYPRAAEQFSSFITSFPDSTNVPAAILYQAQSRHFQKDHDAAIELLRTHLEKAGELAHQYVFTWADALSAKGEHAAAAEQYGRILKEFPNSPVGLQAAYLQAFSHFQLKDYPRAIELLRNPEGDFQKLADAKPEDRFSFAGGLLLGECLLATGGIEEARAVGTGLKPPEDQPEPQWERHDLLARIELAGPNATAALPHLTNAVASAQAAQRARLQAQSWNLTAETHRKLGETNNAVAAYDRISSMESLPIDQRRLALLKSVELLSMGGTVTNAILRLEQYLAGTTNEPAADLLRVKAGELWIEQARNVSRGRKLSAPERTAFTNGLVQARAHLNDVVAQFTNSTHLGRAWLNLGWASWEEGTVLQQPERLQESGAAFRTATERLMRDDQALALFKLADTQMHLKDYRGAVTNYLAVLRNYTELPQVKNALYDRSYAQLVRAQIELGDLPGARTFVAELREAFPNSPLTEESLYLFGQALAEAGEAKEARAVFQDFLTNYPSSTRGAEVRFAEGRTYALEGEYATAIQKHDQWLAAFTNHVLRPEVEFQRGVLLHKADQGTNALAVFSQFVSKYPAHLLAPSAQTWVADHYHGQQQWPQAEQNYQRVFQNTNWAGTRLAYEARIMAAQTAFQRQAYGDAKSYLTNLVNDPRCPPDLQPKALFALGDVFAEEPITGNTNAVNNFIQAAAVFDRVTKQFPTNVSSILALARKGDCYFQLGALTNYPDSYIEATNAYWGVLTSKMPGLPVKVYNQAEFGLALVLERMAGAKQGAERAKLMERALNHLLNIVYGQNASGEGAHPYYLALAGKEAGRLAEAMGNTDAAIQLYKRLSKEAPSLKSTWENRMTMLQKSQERRSTVQ